MAFTELTTPELVDALYTAGLAPDINLLRACLARKDTIRHYLLEMLATDPYEAYELPLGSEDPRTVAGLHAGHLLLAFQEPAALPIFVAIYRDETRKDLVEWFNPWLHEYGAAAVAPFVEVVADEDVHWYGRAAATELLSAVGRRFPGTRATIVAGLREALPELAERTSLPEGGEPDEIWSWIAVTLSELDAQEALPQVKALFHAGLLHRDVTGDLEEYLAQFGEAGHEPRPFNLLDTYRYLHHRVAQEEARQRAERAAARKREVAEASPSSEHERSAPGEPTVRSVPKVGRNDPCPCGSGRKYKHCHGRPGH